MSKDHLTAKERETRKVTLILHAALTEVLNNLEEKDYPYIHTKIKTMGLSNILFAHLKFIERFNEMFKDSDVKISIFDKALCLAMAMQQHHVIGASGMKGRIPQRLCNLNEKAIVEAMLFYIAHSSYHIKRTDVECDFDITVYDNGHKKELKALKELLIEELTKPILDYNKCLGLLHEIYLRAICYENSLNTDDKESLKKKTTIKEKYTVPTPKVEVKNTFSEYSKKFRK